MKHLQFHPCFLLFFSLVFFYFFSLDNKALPSRWKGWPMHPWLKSSAVHLFYAFNSTHPLFQSVIVHQRTMRASLLLLASLVLRLVESLSLFSRDVPAVVSLDVQRRQVLDPVSRDRWRRKRSKTIFQGLDNEVIPPSSRAFTRILLLFELWRIPGTVEHMLTRLGNSIFL